MVRILGLSVPALATEVDVGGTVGSLVGEIVGNLVGENVGTLLGDDVG